jgi:hypothetical protein
MAHHDPAPPPLPTCTRRFFVRIATLSLIAHVAGCSRSLVTGGSVPYGTTPVKDIVYPNPMPLNNMDTEFLWTQIIDTVDDYFDIKTETRVRRDLDQWSDGYVETFPQSGSSYLEPWRKDSAYGFERLQSTFQTIRRTAYLKITPSTTGYEVGIEVTKELEDVDRSQGSGEGSATMRHDGTIVRTDQKLLSLPLTIGWIRQENDRLLEQRILKEIAGRTTNVTLPPKKPFHH